VREGAHVADFGSGSGYFTLLIASSIGPSGVVTAIDVQENPLQVIEARARDEGLHNIRLVRANLEKHGGSTLPDNSQDMVLLANILFQSQKKEDIITEAKRVLKPGGELVMIDWIPETPFGPKEAGWKFSRAEGQKMAEHAQLRFVKEFPASVNHWGLVFKK
jgi:ubiquinone/menaquinone biosynthesis C-methylase UbiE